MINTSTIEIPNISRYQQYVDHQHTEYLQTFTVRQPSRNQISQSHQQYVNYRTTEHLNDINIMTTIQLLNTSNYQQYVHHRYIEYLKLSTIYQPPK